MPELNNSTLQKALGNISEERRLAGHGVRPAAQSFQAFEQFTTDLQELVKGLKELLATLEAVLGMNGDVARRRQAAKASLPRIDRPPESHYSITQLPIIEGKTIKKVEFGFRQQIEGVHQSEAIILHFTDGSTLGIDTGSNAANIASEHEELRAEDFHADFMLSWVPPPQ